MRVRSPATGWPLTSAPSATARRVRPSVNIADCTISLSATSWAALLGTSMPIADLPGMNGWMRIGAASASDRSVW